MSHEHVWVRVSMSMSTAGWAFGFLRAVGFSWSQFLVFFSETSGIDVTLLGAPN